MDDKYELLERVDSPADLKKLDLRQLECYCAELRRFIVCELASNPGHLASSLGAVELAVAVHYVYDTPFDRVIWDVGHQAYAHKIITGRRDRFATNRRLNGISGFPRMSESEYDSFGGGHSSVSISAALGMAEAARIEGVSRQVVAVIGDGAMTGGLAFEGMNNAGVSRADMLVILNDNNMSIDPNVGALKEYLLSISTSRRYNRLKNKTWNALSGAPRLRRLIQKTGNAVKQGILQQSNLFESLNFRYFGPVDGHDLRSLVRVLTDLKNIPGPKLLHALTKKGHGYKPAECDLPVWHAPGKFNPDTGELIRPDAPGSPSKFQDVFGHTLLELAEADGRVVGVTPAMPTGCSMNVMMNRMPGRCFDVGIAEGHAVTFSAGLASQGLVPFCNIYSSFMQRAYDNVIHDVALQNLPVVFCLDRAGIVGEDGATHHGAFDLAFFRCIPSLTVSAPMDELELRDLMLTGLRSGRPFVIRYPRGAGSGLEWKGRPMKELPVGCGRRLREGGGDTAVLSIGAVGVAAARAVERAAAEGIDAAHYDLRFAKPLDTALLDEVGRRYRRVVTVEDGVVAGGVGSAVLEYFSDNGFSVHVERLGIRDRFVEHGTIPELRALCGYDEEAVYRVITSVRP